MHANKRTRCATVPNAIERSSEWCLFVCPTPVRRRCAAAVAATCRRCCAACAATPSPPRASPASPVCLPYVSNDSTHTAETSTALRRRRAGFSAFNSMPRPISTAQGKRDNKSILPAHRTQRERFAYTMHDPRSGRSQGAELWERDWRLEALGTLRASAATRAGATERRAAPTLGRRARRPGVRRTKWDKPLEATMGYLPHTIRAAHARLARTTHRAI